MDRVIFQIRGAGYDYSVGDAGVIVGFCQGKDNAPCAVVRKLNDGHYVSVPLRWIVYNGETK